MEVVVEGVDCCFQKIVALAHNAVLIHTLGHAAYKNI